ncbi:MAG: aspartate kinase, partial [Flavobacteriaceae bacterium]|nr:aspartate kinase [Flavobacteriaceae bacterium]
FKPKIILVLMQVYKFGGASVKDAQGVKNVLKVLKTHRPKDLVIIVSAMGKTTNALEALLTAYFNQPKALTQHRKAIKAFHFDIIKELELDQDAAFIDSMNNLFDEFDYFLSHNKSPDRSFVYDQVVSFGELWSTHIVAAYLNHSGFETQWLDARDYIKTDTKYRDAQVDWSATQQQISQLDSGVVYLTQGFIGSDSNRFTTTLGREGSDYTAAIFAYCLDAQSVSVWKDVPGVLNADPRWFDNPILLNKISYTETIELAFYGASVIHPKTLQPLQRKNIPLHVRSFIAPENPGTTITAGQALDPLVPCYIIKDHQHFLRIATRDFAFIVEKNISEIFERLHHYNMNVRMMQNSAISFSVCLEDKYSGLDSLLQDLSDKYEVTCYREVKLYTVRHFEGEMIKNIEESKEVLLKQRSQETIQIVAAD